MTPKTLFSPVLRSMLFFIAGILSEKLIVPDPVMVFIIFAFAFASLTALYKKTSAGTVLAILCLYLAGMFAVSVQSSGNRQPYIPVNFINTTVEVSGQIFGDSKYYNGNSRFRIKNPAIHSENEITRLEGVLPVILFGKKILPSEGDSISLEGKPVRSETHPSFHLKIPFIKSGYSDYPVLLLNGSNMSDPLISQGNRGFWVNLRKSFSALIDKYDYWGQNGLLKAFLIGDRNGLPQSTVFEFNAAGIAHLIAVSGLNVGILVLSVNFFFGFFNLSRIMKFSLISLLIFLYTGLCGFDPPVARSALMVFCAMAVNLAGIGMNFESMIFSALFVIIAFDPSSLSGASLQLSFVSVWGLGVFYPYFGREINTLIPGGSFFHLIIRNVLLSLSVSLIAFIITAPILAVYFGTLPLYSVIVNLPAVPLSSFIVISGMISVLLTALGQIFSPAAFFMVNLTGIGLKILTVIASFSADLPFSTIKIIGISLFVVFFIYLWLFLLAKTEGRNNLKKILVYSVLLVMLFYTWNPVFSGMKNKMRSCGEVVFLNVDQGDSSFLRCGDGYCFLIDTGLSSQAKTVVVPWLIKIGVSRLDGIFISHMDSDHAGGLGYLIENIRTDKIFCRESVRDSLAVIYGDRVIAISAGDSIVFGKDGALVLSPPPLKRAIWEKIFSGENAQSVVVRMDIAGKRLLFTGDITPEIQRYNIPWGTSLASQVIKIPHHGAKSLSEGFITAVNPSDAVISCGLNNRYGHPSKDTIQLLEKRGVKILRTDYQGSVLIALPSLNITDF